ncbi:MAG: hypothetical protein AAF518_01900 [Spirochaetota bacterium]
MQNIVSKENVVDHISGTPIWIARRPCKTMDLAKFDTVVDLTAEFCKGRVASDTYICLPNVDGIPLTNYHIDFNFLQAKSILVHCANGHGRSALFTAMLLKNLKITNTYQDGLSLIQKSRPCAIPSRLQIKSLLQR